ncbi:hypothetical protein OOK13_45205 [Streptomyces sp. NBC_00378]|uniref:hypothetical protein n=1 Tax=Streptomyces sp. NBC_00378 TaxID=2975732 RepID=UPI002253CB6B|nr:hypothetical protein [Streptomyces sp. NBC_00378]MCX5115498.1 hypothetical protein [Streptomyces sp. NBC_00378]
MCDVRLEWLAAEVMDELPSAEARTAVQALLVDTAGHPDGWPAPGGEEIAHAFGTWCWISYVAYADGLEVRDIGWAR